MRNRSRGKGICKKKLRRTPLDKAVEKTRKYTIDYGLLAVPFDKGFVFCIRRLFFITSWQRILKKMLTNFLTTSMEPK